MIYYTLTIKYTCQFTQYSAQLSDVMQAYYVSFQDVTDVGKVCLGWRVNCKSFQHFLGFYIFSFYLAAYKPQQSEVKGKENHTNQTEIKLLVICVSIFYI